MEKLKNSILNHIRKGDPQGAFDALNNKINPYGSNGKLMVSLEAAFNNLGRAKIAGTVKSEDFTLEMNKINSSLIDLCHYIEKNDLILEDEKVNPERHIAHYLIKRAKVYRQKKDFKNAVLDLTEAARQQPRNIAIKTDLAIIYRLAGDFKEALHIIDEIVENRPNDTIALNEMATFKRDLGRYNSALETLDRGLKLQPDNNHLHSNKFFIHLFFTLDKNKALLVRDAYELAFGKKLIMKAEFQYLYDQFLEHFDAIHNLVADKNLIKSYIEECEKKRAFKTAEKLSKKLVI